MPTQHTTPRTEPSQPISSPSNQPTIEPPHPALRLHQPDPQVELEQRLAQTGDHLSRAQEALAHAALELRDAQEEHYRLYEWLASRLHPTQQPQTKT